MINIYLPSIIYKVNIILPYIALVFSGSFVSAKIKCYLFCGLLPAKYCKVLSVLRQKPTMSHESDRFQRKWDIEARRLTLL